MNNTKHAASDLDDVIFEQKTVIPVSSKQQHLKVTH
jgi:hypothetical protein